jgi:hypothetical protein
MIRSLLVLTFACLFAYQVAAQSTQFSYQGRLVENGSPAHGTYDFRFILHSASSGANTQVGNLIEVTSVEVVNGIFTVALDFGNEFPGADRWLEINVKKTVNVIYTGLTPRQKLASVPYGVRAANVGVTSGDSIIEAINNGATTLSLNGYVRVKPAAPQSSTTATDGSDAMLNLSGVYSDGFQIQPNFKVNHDGTILGTGIGTPLSSTASDSFLPTGVGTRMFWYPRKAAFRAGHANTNPTTVFDTFLQAFLVSPGNQFDEFNIGHYSVAMGENVRASGVNGTAFGRDTQAAGAQSFAVGDANIASGMSSVALGYHAHTNARHGSFVFSDRSTQEEYLRAGVNNSANWRVVGGFRIFTSSNLTTGVTLQSGATISNWGQSNAVISTSVGALLTTGGVWTNASSRELKTGFARVDGREVLRKVASLPIDTWSYRSEDRGIRHIGPVSQDFRRIFGFGDNNEAIGTVDADGVALAAIQGLNDELKDRDTKIAAAAGKVAELELQVKRQQAAIESLTRLVCQRRTGAAVCRK